jgi:hypothetical protein
MLKTYRRALTRGAGVVLVALTVLVTGLVSAGPALAAGGFTMPAFTPTQPPNTESLATLFGWLKWGGLAMCIAGVIITGATMAVAHRNGRGGEHGAALGYVCGGAVLIGAASGLIGALA